jgi:hypothetical protein
MGARCNINTRIYRLPVEILLMIFLFCDFAPIPIEQSLTMEAAWNRARLLISATSVCIRFHAVLKSSPEFWNVRIFTPLGRRFDANVVKQMIHRSGKRPLHVVWDCKGTRITASEECVNALCSVNSTRIRTLSIRLTYKGTRVTNGVFEHRLRPLNLLRATRIECHDRCPEIPFVPSGASTTMLTIMSRCNNIVNFDRYIEVNLPSRLATTLVSLRLKLSIRTRDLKEYLLRCIALRHLEWVVSKFPYFLTLPELHDEQDDDDYSRKPFLSLPETLDSVVIIHPILVPILHAPSLTHARMDVHDDHNIQVEGWEDWDLEMPHVPRLKTLWLSCPCIVTNGLFEAMVDSAALELEKVNIGVQKHTPNGVLYCVNTLRHSHTPRLHTISFGIWPHDNFHTMWDKVAMRLENLLAERHSLRVHSVFVNDRLPNSIQDLVLRLPKDRIVLHSAPDFARLYKTMRDL